MRLFGFEISRTKRERTVDIAPKTVKDKSITVNPGKISRPTLDTEQSLLTLKGKTKFINFDYVLQYIPIIRKLSWVNPDVGVALNDMVQLTNTGHRIKFDPRVKAEDQEKMRKHIEMKQESWGDGVSGMNGLINKMISQIWVGGALSNEWVIDNNLSGIKQLSMVQPETIVFRWNQKKLRFEPYQKQDSSMTSDIGIKYVKLNPSTYKYYGLNGDTDIPYGIPPYLTALKAISVQGSMDSNIQFIMDQIGLLGFTQLLLAKPMQDTGETDESYKARLTTFLNEAKKSVLEGIKDGVVCGFDEDHDFQFQSTTKNLSGVTDLYNQNEVQVANGLKMASEFIGAGSTGSETGINIIFTKMLSQLQNVQAIVSANLKYGYTLELKLAGFKFDSLSVEFNPSTITDELKFQQAQEYKIRNIFNKYTAGVISMQQMADEMGYDKADANEPRGSLNQSGADKEKRQDQNDKSDKKTRDKKKPQPKKGEQKAAAEYLLNELLDLINE